MAKKKKNKTMYVNGTKNRKYMENTVQKMVGDPMGNKRTLSNTVTFEGEEHSPFFRITGGVARTDVTTKIDNRYWAFGKPQYNPQSIKGSLTPAELSKEYTRLRSLAMKRLHNLERAGFEHTQTYKQAKHDLRQISKMSKRHLEDRLIMGIVKANRFLANEESTVRGMKKNINQWIEVMRSKGYDVSIYNYKQVMDALNYVSDTYKNFIYDSSAVVEVAIEEVYKKVSDKGIHSIMMMNSRKVRDDLMEDIIKKYGSKIEERTMLRKYTKKYYNELFS